MVGSAALEASGPENTVRDVKRFIGNIRRCSVAVAFITKPSRTCGASSAKRRRRLAAKKKMEEEKERRNAIKKHSPSVAKSASFVFKGPLHSEHVTAAAAEAVKAIAALLL